MKESSKRRHYAVWIQLDKKRGAPSLIATFTTSKEAGKKVTEMLDAGYESVEAINTTPSA